jgi:TetR/AcrR family transcriptional repressor of nem operon
MATVAATGSRAKILETAKELFYRRGYLATSVDDIIELAKVSKSNFYYHFKSKEDLGLEVLRNRCQEFNGGIECSLLNDELSPMDRLGRCFALVAESREAKTSGGCPFGNLVAEMSEHSERFRQQLSDMFASLAGVIADVVEEGQNRGDIRKDVAAEEISGLIVHTLQGAQLMLKCHRSWEGYTRTMALLLKLIGPCGEPY